MLLKSLKEFLKCLSEGYILPCKVTFSVLTKSGNEQ